MSLAPARAAHAQPENPVYVDDSPAAWEIFRLARDQVEDNPGEAVRLFQELLDDHASKLIPVGEAAADHYTAVRQRVAAELTAQPALLERYQLIQSAQAQRMLDAGDLRRLAVTRGLTLPGLEAILRLAQTDLETARFESAVGWLHEARRHPALTETQAAHGWFMTAVAAHYLGDEPLLVDAQRELGAAREGAAFANHLRGLVDGGPGPAIRRGISSLDRTNAADLSDLVAEEIWSIDLGDSLFSRRFTSMPVDRGGGANSGRNQKRADADLMTAAATASGATVFINQGYTVLALDRFTGRRLWSHVDRHRLATLERDGEQTLDMNFVTVDGDAVVTLTGHAAADGRTTDGKVLCLSAANGDVRWGRTLNGIGGEDDQQELFPHGQPIVAESAVYVLARKVTRQALTSAYVVALDLETGDLLWSRHLASSGGLRRSSRNLSTLTYADGDLYIASAVGAIARLHANSGETRWLRRFPVPISPPFQDQNRRPWEMPAPVVAGDAVIAVQPNQRRIVSIDRETGHLLGSYAAEPHETWYSPRYLVANEHSVYAIGREIRAFRLTMLDRPIWQLPAPDVEDGAGAGRPGSLAQPLNIRGRVQLAGGHLIVPTLDGVLVVDDETGGIDQHLPIRSIGTPLALDAQLLMAGSDRLDAFMSFSRAEEMLRQRVASAPDDPGAALSLLRLGARARELDLALEAATMALRAVDAESGLVAERSRKELFDLLLEIDAAEVAASAGEGEALHAMIGAVADKPDQRVEHLLAYGRWLTRHSMARAVEQYQAILSEPRLAAVSRREDARERPATAWTAERLGQLIERHGASVYGPQNHYASVQLQNLLAAGPDAGRLVALAEEFPFSEAAIDAAVRASILGLRQNDPHAAAAAMLAPYRRTQSPRLLTKIAGAFVRQCETLDPPWLGPARETLEHVVRVAGPIELSTADGMRSAEAWLAALKRTTVALPRVGTRAGATHELPGRLVPMHPDAAPVDSSVALLYDGRELRMLESNDLEERWRHAVEDPAPLVLHRDDRGVLIWLAADREDPRAVMLDARTGRELWSTPALHRHLGDEVNELFQEAGVRKQMPNNQPFSPKETLPLVKGDRLVMVRRAGGAAAFDLDDGAEPRWTTERTLDEVHLAALHEFGLVLAGGKRVADGQGRGQIAPRIVILDPDDGTMRHVISPLAGVRWLRLGPLGTFVYGTSEGVFAADLLTGERRWGNVSFEATDSLKAWIGGDHVVIEDNESELRSLALADGRITDAFAEPAHGDWDPLDIQDLTIVDGRVYARYRQRVVRFDERGAVLGADIITDRREYKWVLPVEEGLVVVSLFNTKQAPVPNHVGRRMQHTYRIYHLSPNCKVRQEHELSKPITSQLTEATAIDRWLLLSSTASNTLAVRLVADEPRAAP